MTAIISKAKQRELMRTLEKLGEQSDKTTTPDEPKVKPRKLPRKMALSEYSCTSYHAFVDDDVTPEEFTAPSFWLHARNMKVHDEIRVVQNTRWTHLLVIGVIAGGGLEVAVLQSAVVNAPRVVTGKELPEGYRIEQAPAGMTCDYVVIRERDGFMINQNQPHKSYEEARAYLLDLSIFRIPPQPSHGS
jgi:hypothetical protein